MAEINPWKKSDICIIFARKYLKYVFWLTTKLFTKYWKCWNVLENLSFSSSYGNYSWKPSGDVNEFYKRITSPNSISAVNNIFLFSNSPDTQKSWIRRLDDLSYAIILRICNWPTKANSKRFCCFGLTDQTGFVHT